ncbi:hypothetical protein [Microcoleus sp. Pol12B5]|uniref:hypothetical protein n=1 Tax=Microcoleus sp. Pol12B5 TaxID=3055396 RepID=UPI002FCFCD65
MHLLYRVEQRGLQGDCLTCGSGCWGWLGTIDPLVDVRSPLGVGVSIWESRVCPSLESKKKLRID